MNDNNIKVRLLISRNPQANEILERVHQSIGNILRTFKVLNMVLDEENPWDGIVASTMFALRATVYTSKQYTPVKLIYGRDLIAINQCHNID